MSLRNTALSAMPALALGLSACEVPCPMNDETLTKVSEAYGDVHDNCKDGVSYDEVAETAHIGSIVRGINDELRLTDLSGLWCTPVKDGRVPEFSVNVTDGTHVWVGSWDEDSRQLNFAERSAF